MDESRKDLLGRVDATDYPTRAFVYQSMDAARTMKKLDETLKAMGAHRAPTGEMILEIQKEAGNV